MPLVRWPFRASPKTNGARSCSPTSSMSRDASTASQWLSELWRRRGKSTAADRLCLPKSEYIERVKQLWERLELPKLKPRDPWFGYNLGLWSDEDESEAQAPGARAITTRLAKSARNNGCR